MNVNDLKFSLYSFRQLDLPNLLINIWDYADKRHDDCPICKQYSKCCVIAAKEKWSSNFIDFDFVINNLKKQNKKWFDVGKLSPASRDNIYFAICKVSMRSPID